MKVYSIKSRNELFSFFNLSNRHWELSDGAHSLAFRGQSNAEWILLPSAFREKRKRTIREQIKNEYETIYDFSRDLIEQGLYHPPVTIQSSIDLLDNINYLNAISMANIAWPNKEYYEIVAIAQHFGLKTRFLDFSLNPLVALYFAASGSIRKRIENMAIFVINTDNVKLSSAFPNGKNDYLRRYQIIQSPTLFNNNLRAQKGIFLGYIEEHFNANDIFDPVSVENYLNDEIIKIEIPVKYNIDILIMLSQNFVDSRSLFPGVPGIVKYMNEDVHHMRIGGKFNISNDLLKNINDFFN